MFEEGIKNFWGTVDRDAFFKSQQCFSLIFKVVQKRKLDAVWQRCWSLQAGGLILPSQFTAVSPYVQHPWTMCWCLSKLRCAWLSSSPSPSLKVITSRPSWGSVFLFSLPKISVKSFCLGQSLLSCCKFKFYNCWCFAGLFQLMSQFSWEFFAAFAVFFSFSCWLINLINCPEFLDCRIFSVYFVSVVIETHPLSYVPSRKLSVWNKAQQTVCLSFFHLLKIICYFPGSFLNWLF